MRVYKRGMHTDGLSPAGFLRAANATFYGPEPADAIRLDAGSLEGPYAVGVWSVEPGEFDLPYGATEFVTILEGRVVVTQGGQSQELGPGDTFFTPKGETVRWKVLEKLKKAFIVVM